MDSSAAQSAAGQTEQALCDARRGSALGDLGSYRHVYDVGPSLRKPDSPAISTPIVK